jgi:hypothetical protein
MSLNRIAALVVVAVFSCSPVFAQDPIDNVMTGCAAEIDNYCSQVSLGEGRLMACFYAHEDKLSEQCIHAVYDAAVAIDEAINAFVYIATSCEADIDTYCGDMDAGEGRILNCLTAKRDSISAECATALQDTEE